LASKAAKGGRRLDAPGCPFGVRKLREPSEYCTIQMHPKSSRRQPLLWRQLSSLQTSARSWQHSSFLSRPSLQGAEGNSDQKKPGRGRVFWV